MYFEKWLSKKFDIDEEMQETDFSKGKIIKTIYVFEKGEDCEPLCILYNVNSLLDEKLSLERRMGADELYRVGNISSKLEHGKEYGEKELRRLLKQH